MKTLFVAAGPITWGSSRMRCWWPARYMDADVIELMELDGQSVDVLKPYDAVIFQKHGVPDLQRFLLDEGKQVWLDQCDPMWWFSPEPMRAILSHCTGVVVSSSALGDDLISWCDYNIENPAPVYLIDDRLELEHFTEVREHEERTPVRFIWYGVAVNRISLYAAWANLSRLAANGYQVELTIFDPQPDIPFKPGDSVPVHHVEWDLERENEVISSHDIALLPPYPGPWGKVKSANKDRTAKVCGLPVTKGLDYWEMVRMVEADYRQELGERGRKDVEELWAVDRSADQWERLLAGEVL